jgi:hypothetical protein
MSDTQAPRNSRGCLFYGCLTLVAVFLVCALGLYFGVRHMYNRVVNQYTSATPMAVPRVEGTPEEIKDVQARFKTFIDSLKTGQGAQPLALAEKELNLLINHTPQLGAFSTNLHVAIEGRKLRGTLSLPLDGIGFKKLKGRYFNGVAELKASLDSGGLLVTLDSLEVNGTPLPEQFMAGMRQQNLAKDLYKDTQSMETLRKLEVIEVGDGRLVIKPRATSP